jgi:CBS domain-containing protein
MKVHEIMTAHARSVSPDTTLVEAAGLMRELDVGALPVCEGDDLTGMVTDRDLVVRGVADGVDPTTARVSDVMSGAVEAITADEEVENAVRIMEQRQIRRLPVLDNAKRLVGIVSLGDIATSSNPAFSGTALRDVSEPHDPSSRQRRLMRQSEPPRASRAQAGRAEPSNSRRKATRSAARSTRAKAKTNRGRATKRKAKAKRGRR